MSLFRVIWNVLSTHVGLLLRHIIKKSKQLLCFESVIGGISRGSLFLIWRTNHGLRMSKSLEVLKQRALKILGVSFALHIPTRWCLPWDMASSIRPFKVFIFINQWEKYRKWIMLRSEFISYDVLKWFSTWVKKYGIIVGLKPSDNPIWLNCIYCII